MKKRLLFLLCMLSADIAVPALLYASEDIDQLHEQLEEDDMPELDLEDDDIISDDEDLLAILDESMEDPSLLWTWFCTIGSSLVAHGIHAQRYMARLANRIKFWIQARGKDEEQKKTPSFAKATADRENSDS